MTAPAMKTIVITGATSGIGRQAALALATPGNRLLVVGRHHALLKTLHADLAARGAGEVHPFHADLSELSDVRRVGAEIAAAAPVIDVLANNAGAIFDTRRLTADGIEMTFALNHLAYWLLTRVLLPNIAASDDGRIICTASRAHMRARLDFADLESARDYTAWMAYGTSKLMNILFTRELARRLAVDPAMRHVSASSFHPGFVQTRFGDGNGVVLATVMRMAKALVAVSEAKGADTLVWLATAPDSAGRSGGYFEKRRPGRMSAAARDDAAARRLWEVTAEFLGEAP